MTQASEQIATQYTEAALNKKNWGTAMYNVLVEGLVGGGVTDDTVALQTLVNTAIAAGRKAIFFPHGTYYVTALTNANQVVFFGDNVTFVGGYTGTVSQLGDSQSADYAKEVAPVFNVMGYGAIGNGITDDSDAILATIQACALVGGGVVYFPRGTYLVTQTITIARASNNIESESSIFFEGMAMNSRTTETESLFPPVSGKYGATILWKGGAGNDGRQGTLFSWGYGVYGGFRRLSFTTGANEGHTSQNLDGFTTTTSTFAGCDSTSSIAISHAYNGPFVIEECNFHKFHYGVQMNLGYNNSIRDCVFVWNNVGIGTYGAATINHYLNNRIERNAIGMAFQLCSAITVESCVSQANYAGCDVYIYVSTHSLHFLRCYFESSPIQVYIQGGGTDVTSIPTGHVFEECNSISITSLGRINDIYLIKGLCQTVPITHSGVDPATYFAVDCYQHVGSPAQRVIATGYNMGTSGILYERNASKYNTQGNLGVGTNDPAGTIYSRYATVEGTYPAFSLKSTAVGGRRYSIAQDIIGSSGALIFTDETAAAVRLILDAAGIFKPYTDGTQSLGSTANRWSDVNTVNVTSDLYKLNAITAASAPNNSLFRDSADNKLKYKDNGGVVNLLY